MARAHRRRIAAAAGIGMLAALASFAALTCFVSLFVGMLFGWLVPGLLTFATLATIACLVIAPSCVFLIRRLAVGRDQPRVENC